MKKIQELFNFNTISFGLILPMYAAYMLAQIGYSRAALTGPDVTVTGTTSASISAPTVSISATAGSISMTSLPTSGAEASTLGSGDYAAGASGYGWLAGFSTEAMNGSDTYSGLELRYNSAANHTGASNSLYGLFVDVTQGDANTNTYGINIADFVGTAGAAGEVEDGIKFGTGWDAEILPADGTLNVSGGVTATGNLATSGTADLTSADDLTVTDDTTLTDVLTANGAVNLGSNDVDDITVNGPVTYKVLRDDFQFPMYWFLEEDFTPPIVTDTGENIIFMPAEQLPVIGFRLEQAFAGSAGTNTFTAPGSLDMSSMVDNVDTDGLDFKLGESTMAGSGYTVNHVVQFDEDTSPSTYCEISLTITTIANIDEFYFGWGLESTGYPDANDVTTLNTTAYFRIPDNAGDVDIETELNAAGTNNDETSIAAWANGGTHILRVTMLADSVSFTYDGTAVTQTNAVLNADNGDQMVCFWGFQNSAAAASAGMLLNYVEIGVSQ